MKRLFKYLMLITVAAAFTVTCTGCLQRAYLFYDDDDFEGVHFSDYDLIQNAELEMDDIDRN